MISTEGTIIKIIVDCVIIVLNYFIIIILIVINFIVIIFICTSSFSSPILFQNVKQGFVRVCDPGQTGYIDPGVKA